MGASETSYRSYLGLHPGFMYAMTPPSIPRLQSRSRPRSRVFFLEMVKRYTLYGCLLREVVVVRNWPLSTRAANVQPPRKGGPELLILLRYVAAPEWWNPSGPTSQSSTQGIDRRRRTTQRRPRLIRPRPLNIPRNTPVLAYSPVNHDHTSTSTCPCVGKKGRGRLGEVDASTN